MATGASKAFVVPVTVFARKILILASDGCLAAVTDVGVQVFVTQLAVGVVFVQDVTVPGQT